jgi:hypothetical protein
MEIKEILMKSSENMKSAFDIESSLKKCKIEMLRKVFKSIEEKLAENNRIKYSGASTFDYNNQLVDSFYNNSKSTWPGISYLYQKDIKPEIDIWIRIEIEDTLFVGYCIPKNNENHKQQLSIEELKTFIPDFELKIDGWWAYYTDLPSKGLSPDFKNPGNNDVYFKLFDEKYFDKFIYDCILKIESFFPQESAVSSQSVE